MRLGQILLLALATGACDGSESGLVQESGGGRNGGEDAPESPSFGETDGDASDVARAALRVDVWPTESVDTGDVPRALAQSFPISVEPGLTHSTGALRLSRPVPQEGEVIGFRLNPLVSLLPGQEVRVGGTLRLDTPLDLQSYATSIGATDGRFQAWLLAGEYTLTVVPDDPLLPLYAESVSIAEDTSDVVIDIGLGVPIYGEVTSLGPTGLPQPFANARVHAVNQAGVRSATAITDDRGRYVLRVKELQPYTVVCEGGARGQDPVWSQPATPAADAGTKVDFHYPIERASVFAEGEVLLTDSDTPLGGAVVRLVAEAIDGFEALPPGHRVSWVWEEEVNSRGVFDAKVVPGAYRVDVRPPNEPAGTPLLVSPTRLVDVQLPGDIGAIRLTPTTPVAVDVVARDGEGPPVPGATVECTELAFGQRTARGTTDEQGRVTLRLPDVQVRCIVTPPAEDLLAIRRTVPFTLTPPSPIVVRQGQEIRGSVLGPDGAPEGTAWVEVRDGSDALLAYGTTDAEGRFSLQADVDF